MELMQLLNLETLVMAVLVPEQREVIRAKSTSLRHSPPCLASSGNLLQVNKYRQTFCSKVHSTRYRAVAPTSFRGGLVLASLA